MWIISYIYGIVVFVCDITVHIETVPLCFHDSLRPHIGLVIAPTLSEALLSLDRCWKCISHVSLHN